MRKDKILQFPHQGPDIKEMMLDGKPEMMLSARGVLLFYLSAWKLDSNEKAHEAVRRYCEYIAAHGCKGGASQLLAELDGLAKEEAALDASNIQDGKVEQNLTTVPSHDTTD